MGLSSGSSIKPTERKEQMIFVILGLCVASGLTIGHALFNQPSQI